MNVRLERKFDLFETFQALENSILELRMSIKFVCFFRQTGQIRWWMWLGRPVPWKIEILEVQNISKVSILWYNSTRFRFRWSVQVKGPSLNLNESLLLEKKRKNEMDSSCIHNYIPTKADNANTIPTKKRFIFILSPPLFEVFVASVVAKGASVTIELEVGWPVKESRKGESSS